MSISSSNCFPSPGRFISSIVVTSILQAFPDFDHQQPQDDVRRQLLYSTYSWTVLIENLKWNGHLARRLDGVAVVQHPARMADLRDLLDRKQHSGFIVRPHERHDSRVIGDPASRSARVP